ncbi:MAG: beta-ketoacyl-[acyl-carrier-protein] synthase family protein [Tannerella sp.]|jgi:3-oxoacyl-[acyl-carrier-protein] synthase-1|nr:beta-ketoacyl-[acyl-carrier-protein] synthase family protein [Tannerella sp.]
MKTEIYITGAGAASAIGMNRQQTLDALINGRSGVEAVRYLQTAHSELPVGEVKRSNDELREMLDIPPSEAFIRSSLLAIPAVREAMAQARLETGVPVRVAFLSGITVGGMDQSERRYNDFLTNNSENAYIRLSDCGACTEQIADYIGGFHSVSTIVTACSSSANTLMLGADMIRTGRADIVVAGGTECLSRYHVNGFNTLMILDREVCKPFDRDRAGINLGEGAGYVVLETAATASKRDVLPLARLSGYSNVCDAYHPTASSPDGIGAYLAMRGAIEDAGLKPEDIDYVNAHGTGTPNNDLTEGLAAMRLFTDGVPPLSSIKAFTGHTTSAAGGFEAVVALLAIEHNFLPVNLNFRRRIEEHNFSPVTDPSPPHPVRHVLSNSFGFGGNDSSIVISKI